MAHWRRDAAGGGHARRQVRARNAAGYYLTGTQALVRLPMMQRQRDAAAGLNTGRLHLRLSRLAARRLRPGAVAARGSFLEQATTSISSPAINEDLAATAVWGSQQVDLFAGAKYDGVFAMWYGKGPGVDRSGDVLKHGNSAGTAPHGGVLRAGRRRSRLQVLDPAAPERARLHRRRRSRCSTRPGCRRSSISASTAGRCRAIPAAGSASRRSPRRWTARPRSTSIRDRVADRPARGFRRCRRAASTSAGPTRRWSRSAAAPLQARRGAGLRPRQPARPHGHRRPTPRFGIVTTGKSYLDVRQALDELGIDDAEAAELGIRLYKVGMTWPLEPRGRRAFRRGARGDPGGRGEARRHRGPAQGAALQLAGERRPRVVGKNDEARRAGSCRRPASSAPAQIARVIAAAPRRASTSAPRHRQRLAFLDASERAGSAGMPRRPQRTPYFCSGCPHNTSTQVPEGSRALAGIGCHYMAQWMDRETATFTQMGGEGAPWIGQAPFTETPHVFPNLGDGTYYPFRHPGDPRRGRRRRQHHLQDPVQRRGGDDRRPAGRRAARPCRRSPASSPPRASAGSSSSPTSPRNIRSAPAFRRGVDGAPPRRARRGAARAARDRRASRAWSTTRPAPPRSAAAASAASFPIRRSASSSTSWSARAAAIARAPVELRLGDAGRDRVRPQARHRPVELQQGFLLRQRLLPELRHRAWRQPAQAHAPAIGEDGLRRRCPSRRCPALDRALRHPGHRHRRHRRRHHRRAARHGRASRRQGRAPCST